MGYSLALGGLPKSLLVGGQLGVVLDSLMKSCSDMSPKFGEARRDAVCSITRYGPCMAHACTHVLSAARYHPLFRVCSSLAEQPGDPRGGVASGSCDLSVDDVERVFSCYMRCLGDYTMDSRGDIGALVREAAMAGIRTLLPILTPLSPEM